MGGKLQAGAYLGQGLAGLGGGAGSGLAALGGLMAQRRRDEESRDFQREQTAETRAYQDRVREEGNAYSDKVRQEARDERTTQRKEARAERIMNERVMQEQGGAPGRRVAARGTGASPGKVDDRRRLMKVWEQREEKAPIASILKDLDAIQSLGSNGLPPEENNALADATARLRINPADEAAAEIVDRLTTKIASMDTDAGRVMQRAKAGYRRDLFLNQANKGLAYRANPDLSYVDVPEFLQYGVQSGYITPEEAQGILSQFAVEGGPDPKTSRIEDAMRRAGFEGWTMPAAGPKSRTDIVADQVVGRANLVADRELGPPPMPDEVWSPPPPAGAGAGDVPWTPPPGTVAGPEEDEPEALSKLVDGVADALESGTIDDEKSMAIQNILENYGPELAQRVLDGMTGKADRARTEAATNLDVIDRGLRGLPSNPVKPPPGVGGATAPTSIRQTEQGLEGLWTLPEAQLPTGDARATVTRQPATPPEQPGGFRRGLGLAAHALGLPGLLGAIPPGGAAAAPMPTQRMAPPAVPAAPMPTPTAPPPLAPLAPSAGPQSRQDVLGFFGNPMMPRVRVTDSFGPRAAHPITGRAAMHEGFDIGGLGSGADVRSPFDGEVVAVGPAGGLGVRVTIRRPDGSTVTMGHLSEALVQVGQRVAAGDQLGLSGATGRATGPHVHMEFRDPEGNAFAPPFMQR